MVLKPTSEHAFVTDTVFHKKQEVLAGVDGFIEENKRVIDCMLDITHDHKDGSICLFDPIRDYGAFA